jgi:hypothetical protein
MDRRVTAAQKTKDRFDGKPWKPGKFDCWQMGAYHCRAIGKPLKIAPKIGTYHAVATGIRRLRKLGFDDIPAVLDEAFQRIPPAAAIAGDIVQLASEDDSIGGITVCLGNGRVLGFHEFTGGACVMQPFEMKAAWRVI